MRDPVLREALSTVAAEAAARFSSLVAGGEEIPFDVAEDSGENTLFYRYVPLTARFISEREDELRSLPSFGPACAAVSAAGIAAPYLEARGEAISADPDERAACMLTSFIAGLWEGCAEFSLDRVRLQNALHALDAETRDIREAALLIAPIVGLQMPLPRLQLPSGVQVVRADTVDAPIEAMRSEGMQRAAWEPQFLALAELGEGREGVSAALAQLHDLISVLRLFREGGVGLGPHAFAPTGEDKWRRIATGAPGTRLGGYKLGEEECTELRGFARDLEVRPDPEGALAWAVARFEMGCERASALEGLSDHLLALRAVLEGPGPVDAELPVRAAALIVEGTDRSDAQFRIERAQQFERSQMSGNPLEPAGEDADSALELAAWIEGSVRSILSDAALGHLGDDLCAAADESLIATGLEAGESVESHESHMGGTAEWDALEAEEVEEEEVADPGPAGAEISVRRTVPAAEPKAEAAEGATEAEGGEEAEEQETRIMEPVPIDESEIRVTARRDTAEAGIGRAQPDDGEPMPREDLEEMDYEAEEDDVINRDWLSEVSRDATLEWPATSGEGRLMERERIDTPRVRHLFPVPENADWHVRELEYDRTQRTHVS